MVAHVVAPCQTSKTGVDRLQFRYCHDLAAPTNCQSDVALCSRSRSESIVHDLTRGGRGSRMRLLVSKARWSRMAIQHQRAGACM